MPRPLTIVHVTAPAAVGGLESVVHTLAAGHRRQGHNVHVAAVVAPDDAQHAWFGRLEADGVVVHRVIVSARGYREERAVVADLCQKLQPDALHTHGYRPDVVDAPVARRCAVPTVSTIHGFTYDGLRGRLYEWLQRKSLRRSDAVVAVSAPQVNALVKAGVSPQKIHLIRNAWAGDTAVETPAAARRQLGASDGAFHIGWVGRLSYEKGADVLLDAIGSVRTRPVEVSIVGEGSERAALQELVKRTGNADRVRWHGLIPDAHRLYAGFDVFVLSSRTEGTPIVLLEAMAAGVPIVAAAVGGVPDVVSGNEALLVEKENPAALARAIDDVCERPAAAQARAAAARQRLAQEFALDPWLTRYEELYRSLRSPMNPNRSER